jgi:argininosuccinate lyase
MAGVLAVVKGTPTTYNKDFQVRTLDQLQADL